jgi:hypothetical protein
MDVVSQIEERTGQLARPRELIQLILTGPRKLIQADQLDGSGLVKHVQHAQPVEQAVACLPHSRSRHRLNVE